MITILTVRQQRALAAIIEQPCIADAAEAIGVDASTIRRYMQQPEFIEAYDRACSTMIGDATKALKSSLESAIGVARTILENNGESSSIRLQAGRLILDNACRFAEVFDFEQRLKRLEDGIQYDRRDNRTA